MDDVFTVVATVTSPSYVHTDVIEGTTYIFRVRARNGVGYGEYSDELTITAATLPS